MNPIRTCYTENHLNIFRQPACIIIAGYTNSGKNNLATQLILKYASVFSKIVICSVAHHPLQEHPSVKAKLWWTKILPIP